MYAKGAARGKGNCSARVQVLGQGRIESKLFGRQFFFFIPPPPSCRLLALQVVIIVACLKANGEIKLCQRTAAATAAEMQTFMLRQD